VVSVMSGVDRIGSPSCLCDLWEKRVCLLCGWGGSVLDDCGGIVSLFGGTLTCKLHSVVSGLFDVAGALAST